MDARLSHMEVWMDAEDAGKHLLSLPCMYIYIYKYVYIYICISIYPIISYITGCEKDRLIWSPALWKGQNSQATYIIILCLAYGSRTFVRAERSKLRQENLPGVTVKLSWLAANLTYDNGWLKCLGHHKIVNRFGCFNWVDTHVSSHLLKLCMYIYIYIS